ncbi:MAG: efflux RND transporter periplasmic adaptor subunit [Isosphaeraceae bacterium]|nr:efflux RND transporter periplasmic adaptor subunit [Isosphaeraceae bacterium]
MPEDVATTPQRPTVTGPIAKPSSARRRLIPVLGLLLAIGLGAAWWLIPRTASHPGQASTGKSSSATSSAGALRVEVISPYPKGLGRVVVQPGTILAFDKADLYAKVSGYLVRQRVDIGSAVKKGEVLAEVDVPELFKSRDQARAALGQAKAKLDLAEAKVLTIEADRQTAAATVTQTEAELAKFTAERVFRDKERNRIAELVKRNAVQQEILDEKQQQYDAAVAAERTGVAAIAATKASLSAAAARVAQARAEVEQCKADVIAAEADLAKAQVFVDYTKLTSPYDGVITHRSFHDGSFIRSAAEGGAVPVLSVARTDLMRVVIMVPDLDVPFVDQGDPVTIRVDAFPGQVFRGKVARFANSETELKLMRTEVDLPNPDNRLRDGMYGTATIEVDPPSLKQLTIPSTCLIDQSDRGEGAVYVVRNGKVERQAVRVGRDNGQDVEVISGLDPNDKVIARYNGSIAQGLAVETTEMDRTSVNAKKP